jgi:hypothetical protein
LVHFNYCSSGFTQDSSALMWHILMNHQKTVWTHLPSFQFIQTTKTDEDPATVAKSWKLFWATSLRSSQCLSHPDCNVYGKMIL